MDDFDEYDINIDEQEALNDLQDLVLPDEDMFVDICEVDGPKTAVAETGNVDKGTIPTDKPNLQCLKCRKVYKISAYHEQHTKQCIAKRQALRESWSSEIGIKRQTWTQWQHYHE